MSTKMQKQMTQMIEVQLYGSVSHLIMEVQLYGSVSYLVVNIKVHGGKGEHSDLHCIQH